MSSKSYGVSGVAQRKAFCHILKYSKNDCIGVLLGTNGPEGITVSDAVPLFHDRVFTSTLEAAFTMISAVYDTKDKQIVGVYDAPLKNKENSASSPLSSLSSTVAEQIRQTLQVQDVMALSLRVPNKKLAEEEEDADYQVKEV